RRARRLRSGRPNRHADRAPVLALLLRQPADPPVDPVRPLLAVARERLGGRERDPLYGRGSARARVQPALLRPAASLDERAEARRDPPGCICRAWLARVLLRTRSRATWRCPDSP